MASLRNFWKKAQRRLHVTSEKDGSGSFYDKPLTIPTPSLVPDKFKSAHMAVALIYAGLSRSKRSKVGAVIVRGGRIMSIGYNGTPPGDDNCCEDTDGNTKQDVIHAEMNAIYKMAKCHESSEGASIFCTLSPCIPCAIAIHSCGIREFYYLDDYRIPDGLDWLKDHDVRVEKISFDSIAIPEYDRSNLTPILS